VIAPRAVSGRARWELIKWYTSEIVRRRAEVQNELREMLEWIHQRKQRAEQFQRKDQRQ
jgi:hypothetical protein